MKEEITDEQLIAFIEGERNDFIEKQIVENHQLKERFHELKTVLEAISASEPFDVPAHIQNNFQQAIISEQQKAGRGVRWFQLAAAVALLVVGFTAGKFSGNSGDNSELIGLKKEIESLKEITLTSALKQYSASERIMAVNQIETTRNTTPKFAETLVKTLNNDDSPNVRYAALQALGNFIDNEIVRSELVSSLENQKDPLIQIALISMLMEASERSAIVPIKEILDKENTTPEVKKQAEIALDILT